METIWNITLAFLHKYSNTITCSTMDLTQVHISKRLSTLYKGINCKEVSMKERFIVSQITTLTFPVGI